MSVEEIVCRYVFDRREYKNAQACYRKTKPRNWWLVVFWVGLIGFIVWQAFSDATSPQSNQSPIPLDPHPYMVFASNFLPIVIFISLIFVFVFYRARKAFQKGAFFDREVTYHLDEAGIRLSSPLIHIECQWEAIPRATENKNGFVVLLLGMKSFHWLPKSGFASPEAIAQCRGLLRQHVQDARKLSSS